MVADLHAIDRPHFVADVEQRRRRYLSACATRRRAYLGIHQLQRGNIWLQSSILVPLLKILFMVLPDSGEISGDGQIAATH
jgi:hypothetical protein